MARGTKQLITYGALAVLVVLSGGLAYGAVAGSDTAARSNTRTVTVATGSISQTVSATGNLQPAGLVSVEFAASGTISEIDVAPGEQVTAGAVLAKLDPTQAQSALEVATLNLASAQAKLTQARTGTASGGQSSGGSSGPSPAQLDADGVALSDAQNAAAVNAQGYQLDVDQAQAQLDKDQKQLADDQHACEASSTTTESTSSSCNTSADQAAVDKDQNALGSARQKQAQGLQHDQQAVHTAQAKLDTDQASASAATAAGATTIDQAAIDSAQAGVIQAQASVASAQKALDATTLVAPSAGTISTVARAVGDEVSAGSSSGSGGAAAASGTGTASSSASGAAFTIVDPTAFEVKVAFPESDAVKIKVGQAATTTLDALTGTSLVGTVTSVDSTATVTSNVVTYNAIVSVTGAPSTARSGMTANVSVTTVSKDNVVELATAAVQTQAGTSFVDKLVNGQIQQADVTTGIQGDSSTEILSGLQAGDQVVINTGTVSTSATPVRTGGGAGTLGGGGFQGGGGGGGGFPGGRSN